MKIFVTGIGGFLGSHIAERMIQLGHEVVGNDTFIGGYSDNIPRGTSISYEIDCCDLDRMTQAMKRCDIVIHTAATAHEGLSVFSPSFITKNIFEATVSTISAAIQNNVKRFVHCTSMARYGNQQTPFTEDMAPMPVDPYGIAKAASEQVLIALCDTHGMDWNIAVPHNIVGPRQKYDDPFRNVMSIMINRNLRGLPAIIYGNGEQTRCFSYVDDCIDCLEKMALDSTISKQIINIGPDEGTITIKQLADMVALETGFAGEFVYMPDRPREVKHAMCSSDKARKLLAYETKTSIKEAIQKTVEYIKNKGPKPFEYDYPLEIINDKTPKTWKDRLI